MENVYALRGATTVDFDSVKDVDDAVKELMDELYQKNGLTDEDIAFIHFSQTVDIKSQNAAASFRKTGKGASVPLFCTQEAEISGALERVIRVLVLVNHEKRCTANMVYLRKAVKLRPDLVN
ncbi:MAG TPA: chorismate mutase [Candidatus Ornithospirochaeta avicola]|uniref:chorismate mutase n=1 Tax=Candidatus Ornithospirochaeta avicola TaxID=2840896 RepID=A0A9D1TPG8_9SPIO|nr:chorismate mutase [Candidatus Ornithospirochaeta avicola]